MLNGNRGRALSEQWVFGGISRETKVFPVHCRISGKGITVARF